MRELIIDDATGATSRLGTAWRLVGDTVMGGVSRGTLTQENVAGRPAWRMRGSVSLENNGGFLQMALDLARLAKTVSAALRRLLVLAHTMLSPGSTRN